MKNEVMIFEKAVCKKRLYYLSKPDCEQCKLMAPIIDKVERSGVEVIRLYSNTQDGKEFAKEYGFSSVPAMVATSGCDEVVCEGVVPEKTLMEYFE